MSEIAISGCSEDGCPGFRICAGKSRCDVRFHEGVVIVIENCIEVMDEYLTLDEWEAKMTELNFTPANGRSSKYTSINKEVSSGFMTKKPNPSDKRSKIYKVTDKIFSCLKK